MKLIVGLGNPGRLYKDSRHNIGFTTVKVLSKVYKIPLRKEKGIPALTGKGRITGKSVVLALPLTFMNLSGIAVRGLLKEYKIDLKDLLVVCDDLDLGLGSIKIRPRGTSAGHRGIKSVIDTLRTESFPRLRLGIGRPADKEADTAEYVLSPFTRREKEELKEIIENACECCRTWINHGIIETMNIFNRRSKIMARSRNLRAIPDMKGTEG